MLSKENGGSKVILRKRAMYSSIPQRLLDLEIPSDLMVRLADLVDFGSESFSVFELYVLDSILIVLNTNDTAGNQRVNLCFVLSNIHPPQ